MCFLVGLIDCDVSEMSCSAPRLNIAQDVDSAAFLHQYDSFFKHLVLEISCWCCSSELMTQAAGWLFIL